jgi:general nucleoside transport system permease protein
MNGLDFGALVGDAVAAAAPLLFAALGGLFTELSGTLNIALEGLILIGAFFSAAAAGLGHSLALGLAAGVAASTLVAALYGFVTLRGRANEFVTGLAANLLASGLAVVLSAQLFKTKGILALDLPPLRELGSGAAQSVPFFGQLFFGHTALVYASWLAVPIAALIIRKTPFGLRLRAAGSNPKALLAQNLRPERYRFAAILISGAACGLAGACLSLSLAAYVPNMSSGRGWIALVAIYLGGKKPAGILAACLAFALADSFANYAQGFLKVPSDFILALPYALTFVALVAGAAVKRGRSR